MGDRKRINRIRIVIEQSIRGRLDIKHWIIRGRGGLVIIQGTIKGRLVIKQKTTRGGQIVRHRAIRRRWVIRHRWAVRHTTTGGRQLVGYRTRDGLNDPLFGSCHNSRTLRKFGA